MAVLLANASCAFAKYLTWALRIVEVTAASVWSVLPLSRLGVDGLLHTDPCPSCTLGVEFTILSQGLQHWQAWALANELWAEGGHVLSHMESRH